MTPGFRHQGCSYGSDAEFLAMAVPFVDDGLRRDEPVLVSTTPVNLGLLRDALGAGAGRIVRAEADQFGRRPPRLAEALRRYWTRHRSAAPAGTVRVLAEPARIGEDGAGAAWQRAEAGFEVSLAGTGIWLVCPYDTRVVEAEVIEDARRAHPECWVDGRTEPCPDFAAPDRPGGEGWPGAALGRPADEGWPATALDRPGGEGWSARGRPGGEVPAAPDRPGGEGWPVLDRPAGERWPVLGQPGGEGPAALGRSSGEVPAAPDRPVGEGWPAPDRPAGDGPQALDRPGVEVPAPPGAAADVFPFEGDLVAVRRYVLEKAGVLLRPENAVAMFGIAVGEAFAYLLRHGIDRAAVWVRPAAGRVVCTLHSDRPLDLPPFFGSRPPDVSRPDNSLWMTDQICEWLDISSDAGGCTIELAMPGPPAAGD